MSLTQKEEAALSSLNPLDRYIFQFIKSELNCSEIDHPFGGKNIHSRLIAGCQDSYIRKELEQLSRQTFHSKANRMVSLARACSGISK
jgi:hypothetical protein